LSLLKPLLPSLPPIPTPACDLTKKVKTELDKQLGGLPLPTQQYTQVVTTAAAQLSCSSSAAQIASAVATALAGVLNALPQNVIGQLCGNASTNPLCTALKAPGPLSPTSIPGVGQLLQNGTSSGGGLGLPRAQLGSGYQVPQPIDPFGLAAKGYDPGVGTILFEGVATHR
ncbi:MAG: hypothetical protein JOZ82_00970, partial [Marmoricola sp.]|nr:hypothetical protein [Marmoricola sp.]